MKTLSRYLITCAAVLSAAAASAQNTPTATNTALPTSTPLPVMALDQTQITNKGEAAGWAAPPALVFTFPNEEGRTVLLVRNQNASALATITVASVAESTFGRTGDIAVTNLAQYDVAILGPFAPSGFNIQSGANRGRVKVTLSSVTGVTVAAYKLVLP